MDKKSNHKKIILDKTFWNNWFLGWSSYHSSNRGGVLSNISNEMIKETSCFSEEIKNSIIKHNEDSCDFLSTHTHGKNWIDKFENVFILPDHASILFLTAWGMNKSTEHVINFISTMYGSSMLFDCLTMVIKGQKVDLPKGEYNLDLYLLKEYMKLKEFKTLKDEDKKNIYMLIKDLTDNVYDRDYRVLGLKARVLLGHNEDEISSYLRKYKNDTIFLGRAERFLKKEIVFEDESLSVGSYEFGTTVNFNVADIMRITKLPLTKTQTLIQGFMDNNLSKMLQNHGFITEYPTASNLKIVAKNLDDLKVATELAKIEMDAFEKILPNVKFSNLEERDELLRNLKSIVLHKELKDGLQEEIVKTTNHKKMKI